MEPGIEKKIEGIEKKLENLLDALPGSLGAANQLSDFHKQVIHIEMQIRNIIPEVEKQECGYLLASLINPRGLIYTVLVDLKFLLILSGKDDFQDQIRLSQVVAAKLTSIRHNLLKSAEKLKNLDLQDQES